MSFESRSALATDTIKVGMVETGDKDRWIPLGTSSAWNWQRGRMLQGVPGSKTDFLWNDRADDEFVRHIMNVRTGKKRTFPSPVYTLSPGYGYSGVPDPNASVFIPDDVGISRVDLASGKRELLISVSDAARISYPAGTPTGPSTGSIIC